MRFRSVLVIGSSSIVLIATARAEDPNGDLRALAGQVVAAREAESGFDWDERFRLSLTQSLASLPASTLLRIASEGPEVDIRRAAAGQDQVGASIGDANRDLVFTPITPCRVAVSMITVPSGGATSVNYRIRGSTGFA